MSVLWSGAGSLSAVWWAGGHNRLLALYMPLIALPAYHTHMRVYITSSVNIPSFYSKSNLSSVDLNSRVTVAWGIFYLYIRRRKCEKKKENYHVLAAENKNVNTFTHPARLQVMKRNLQIHFTHTHTHIYYSFS